TLLLCSVHVGALHAFPTRRSSDLRASAGSSTKGARQPSKSSATSTSGAATNVCSARVSPGPPGSVQTFVAAPEVLVALDFDGCRSEEHTSELQSRFDLVCRLLLEK